MKATAQEEIGELLADAMSPWACRSLREHLDP